MPRACAICAGCAPSPAACGATSRVRPGAEAERDPRIALVLDRVGRLLAQKPQDRDKLYALHAPEVECIGKGKARVRYEFGVKCSLAVTNARAAGGQFVLGARTVPGNPYDGHTLAGQIDQVEAPDRPPRPAGLCRPRLSRPQARARPG